jgi:hypothetical protein
LYFSSEVSHRCLRVGDKYEYVSLAKRNANPRNTWTRCVAIINLRSLAYLPQQTIDGRGDPPYLAQSTDSQRTLHYSRKLDDDDSYKEYRSEIRIDFTRPGM